MARTTYNPWRELRALGERVELGFEDLGGLAAGMSWTDDGWHGVVLHRGMTQQERNETLAHELIHLEMGGGCEHPDPVVRLRDERRVDVCVAERLVPAAEFLEWLATQEGPLMVWDIAEEWGVSEAVVRALRFPQLHS